MAEVKGISQQINRVGLGNNHLTGITALKNVLPSGNKAVSASSLQTPLFCFEVLDENSDPINGANIIPQTNFDGLYADFISGTSGTTNTDGLGYVKINRGRAIVSAAGYRTQTVVYDFSILPKGDCITVQLVPVSSMASRAFTFGLPSQVVVNENNVDYCDFECEYKEIAFFSSSSDAWKNDTSSFLFSKVRQADTISLELWKGGAKVDDITDNTYGEYFPTLSEFVVGFKADWNLIANAQGVGTYQIVAQTNILGNDGELQSRLFEVLPYDDLLANNTVVIETVQTGNIIRAFDYDTFEDGEWTERVRLKGEFRRVTPEFESDLYLDSDYRKTQIKDKVVNRFELMTRLVPDVVYKFLTQDASLSNITRITDYNFMNNEIYRNFPVKFEGFGEVSTYGFNRNYTLSLDFSDRYDNVRKRN